MRVLNLNSNKNQTTFHDYVKLYEQRMILNFYSSMGSVDLVELLNVEIHYKSVFKIKGMNKEMTIIFCAWLAADRQLVVVARLL